MYSHHGIDTQSIAHRPPLRQRRQRQRPPSHEASKVPKASCIVTKTSHIDRVISIVVEDVAGKEAELRILPAVNFGQKD